MYKFISERMKVYSCISEVDSRSERKMECKSYLMRKNGQLLH